MRNDDTMNILLVTGTALTVKALTPHIRALGGDVTACADADAAFEASRQAAAPLMIVDATLPALDLADFCGRMRALPLGDQSLFVALIRSDQPQELQAALAAGVDEYLLTPLKQESATARFTLLARQLRNLAQRRRAEELLANTLAELRQADEELRVQNAELLASNDELRQIQTNLELSRRKYADLYDFAPIGYCTLTEDGTVVEANLTAARLLGDERSRLIGVRFYHGIIEDDRERFFLHLRALGKTRRAQTCELRLLRQDGTEFSAQLDTSVTPESDPHDLRYQMTISDITARAQMEAELYAYRQHLEELVEQRTRELRDSTTHLQHEIAERRHADLALRTSEQQYRLLAENVTEGLGIIQNGRLMFVNDALAVMLGYTSAQLVGAEALGLVRADYRDGFAQRVQALTSDDAGHHREIAYCAKDGREVWVEAHQRRIEWEGRPALLMTMRDVTARKLREQAMERERAHLRQENVRLRSAIEDRSRFGEMIGKSPEMQEVYAQIVTAAAVEANVLISGESGTGKELAARTIHQLSRRKTQEFVAVNCGAIPENLFEREFFGHRKGAFTGADRDAPGLFDRAHKGTLFLDEVGELPSAMQVKLLRVLETGEYTPVGQNAARHVDARLVAASNKDLEALVRNGAMREDFFYRIYVLTITMPPLRRHPQDIPLLLEDFLHQHVPKSHDLRENVPDAVLEALMRHTWPGNVRELYNVLQRYLQEQRLEFSDTRRFAAAQGVRPAAVAEGALPDGLTFREAIEAYEQRLITTALQQNLNNTAKAADSLDIPLRTLYRKIDKYHLLPD